MKKHIFSILLTFIVLFTVLPNIVSAHTSGTSYVKINGVYVAENPILEYASPVAMKLGSDIATNSAYLVNFPVLFEVDNENFPNPYANSDETAVAPSFRWSFGDSTEKLEGIKVTHTYTKPGTYIVDVDVMYEGKANEYSSVNTIQINIIPFEGYTLPRAKISVNNRHIADPVKDIFQIRGNRTVVFDASASEGDIVSYVWDFSDEKKGNGKIVTHSYNHGDYFPMFPVLRVTDRNNISHDAFVFLDATQSTNILINFIGWLKDIFTSFRGDESN